MLYSVMHYIKNFSATVMVEIGHLSCILQACAPLMSVVVGVSGSVCLWIALSSGGW